MRAPIDDRGPAHELPVLPGLKATLRPITHPPLIYGPFYNISCTFLWLLHHRSSPDPASAMKVEAFRDSWHSSYVPVNKAFANAIVDTGVRNGRAPLLFVHDIHLYLVTGLVRERLPDAKILHFIHPPWPSPDVFMSLPPVVAGEIFRSLLQVDIMGLQTGRDVLSFLECASDIMPEAEVDFANETICYRHREVKVRRYPVATDVGELVSTVDSASSRAHLERLTALSGELTIVRVDRVDPIKNIPNGFRAYSRLLESHPELRGRVNFLAFLIPGPSDIQEYAECMQEIYREAEAVNARYGSVEWKPVTIFCEDNYRQSIAALRLYDVLLVNPVMDGMNLVSMEGPMVNERDGALVLSRTAGSYEQLKDGAIPISPGDLEETANALYRALTMSAEERKSRADALRSVVEGQDATRWLHGQISDLGSLV